MDHYVAALILTSSQITALSLFNRLFLNPRKRARSFLVVFLLFCFICSLFCVTRYQWAWILPVFGILYFFRGTKRQLFLVAVLFLQLVFLAMRFFGKEPFEAGYGASLFLLFLFAANQWRRKKPRLLQYIGIKELLIWGAVNIMLLLFFEQVHRGQPVIIGTALMVLPLFALFTLEKVYQLRQENRIVTKQLEFEQAKVRQMSSYLKTARKMVHDAKKQSQVLGEPAEFRLKTACEELDFPPLLVYTGNDFIDSQLYCLQEKCQQESIKLDQQLVIRNRILLDEHFLANLLDRLFDYAIAKVKQNNCKQLQLSLRTSSQFLLIELSYFAEEYQIKLLSKFTEEASARIAQQVEEVSGFYERTCVEKEHQVKVMLPLQIKDGGTKTNA